MKKIPTLFIRQFESHRIVGVTDKITPGCEEAFLNGTPTIKIDGACCAIIDGVLYKRYDAKNGKKPPEGAIPCCAPDPVTGHWPHWLRVDQDKPEDKWFCEALKNSTYDKKDGTYEAVGPHFQSNPYGYDKDVLHRHGVVMAELEQRDFKHVKEWLENNKEEGLVFWYKGEPVCKIKRTDFGLPWNNKKQKGE